MLTGEYCHTIDSKGRVFVPAKLREALGDLFMVSKNVDGCLSLYPMAEWEKLTEKLSLLPDSQTKTIKRFLFTFASDVSCDAQGRITLPPRLREWAGLVKDAAFLGVGDHAELWSAERWEALQGGEDAKLVEQMMKELGL